MKRSEFLKGLFIVPFIPIRRLFSKVENKLHCIGFLGHDESLNYSFYDGDEQLFISFKHLNNNTARMPYDEKYKKYCGTDKGVWRRRTITDDLSRRMKIIEGEYINGRIPKKPGDWLNSATKLNKKEFHRIHKQKMLKLCMRIVEHLENT